MIWKSPYLALFLSVLWAISCSSAQQSSKGNNAGKQSSPQGANSNGQLGGTQPDGNGNSRNGPATGPSNPTAAAAAPTKLAGWCKAVADSNIVQIPEHKQQFGFLCTADKQPTETFVRLITGGFAGTGEPQITSLSNLEPRSGQVAWTYGSAIKLPISAEKHFNSVGLKQGDADLQKLLLVADGASNVVVTSKPLTSNGDKGWSRGWEVAQDWTKLYASILEVRTAYSYRVDHYDFGDGNYLYASTMVQAVALIRNYQLLNALLTVDGTAYLVVIGDTAIADQGLPDIAASSLVTTVRKAIKQVYQQSAATN